MLSFFLSLFSCPSFLDFVEIFTKIHWKFILSSPSFQVIFRNYTKKYEKKCLRHVFIQNCIRILVDTMVLAVSFILWVKNANKVDPFDVFTSKSWISDRSTLFAFFTHKIRLIAKMIVSTRILMKFWINPCLKHFFSHFLYDF